MTQIHIMQGSPEIVEGISTKSGTPKPYRIVKQAAMLVNDDGSVAAFMIQPAKGAPPYAAGKYALGVRSFVMNGELRLAPALTALPGAPK